MNWQEWEEVLVEVGRTWPVATQGEGYLTTDYAGQYAKLDTLRNWFGLLKVYEQSQVFSAVFRYANTDPDSQWPPQGPTLARYAREVAAEDNARAARERPALPPSDPDAMPLKRFLEKRGYTRWRDYAVDRCREKDHYLDWVTDATCGLCNGRAPMREQMAESAGR